MIPRIRFAGAVLVVAPAAVLRRVRRQLAPTGTRPGQVEAFEFLTQVQRQSRLDSDVIGEIRRTGG